MLEQQKARVDQDFTRESVLRRKLHNQIEDMKGKIRVLCRVRPASEKERRESNGLPDAVVQDGEASLTVLPAKDKGEKKRFHFDTVFLGGAQDALFEDVRHLITSTVDGYNVCLFCYGQTGSGKTYTMGSDSRIGDVMAADGTVRPSAGIAPRAAQALFDILKERSSQSDSTVTLFMHARPRRSLRGTLRRRGSRRRREPPPRRRRRDPVSRTIRVAGRGGAATRHGLSASRSRRCRDSSRRYEVYCDKLVDLLRDTKGEAPPLKITLAEHSPTGLVQVEGAAAKPVGSAKELVDSLARGIANRTVHATKMNSESSRSHLAMMMEIESVNRRTGAKTTGKLTLVDLAGSERVDRSGAKGQQLREAAAINKSLSALGDVINSLTNVQASGHVPYRNHPLTMLMSDSVGGSAKTMMIVCSSPAHTNISETLSSLQFATRCKDVRSSADPRAAAAEIAQLKAEVARLKAGGAAARPAVSGHSVAKGPAKLGAGGPRRRTGLG